MCLCADREFFGRLLLIYSFQFGSAFQKRAATSFLPTSLSPTLHANDCFFTQ